MDFLLKLCLCIALISYLSNGCLAFGAGSIPSHAYLYERAYKHGDISNVLLGVHKVLHLPSARSHRNAMFDAVSGGWFALSGLRDQKFSKTDVKRIYFGNWLRDYSQAMDVAGLRLLRPETLLIVIQILGFMTFGFATEEYEITLKRLGVYLPVEHIDNPRGYSEKEGDARRIHPALRPPVQSNELAIDSGNGMKNYIATEGRGWETSTAFIRRTLTNCILSFRKRKTDDDNWVMESYRLLGAGLHTLEDFVAHSNWCELALRYLGYRNVFCHVGDRVRIATPNGLAPPLVTGTFGSADFLHSVLGEATDHLSSASVEDLAQKLQKAGNSGSTSGWVLKQLLAQLPTMSTDDMRKVQTPEEINMRVDDFYSGSHQYEYETTHGLLWEVLVWRDSIMRIVISTIAMIPGLNDLLEAITEAINDFVFTILSPILVPILQEVTSVLQEQSREVIASEDQYEVFDNPLSSDPTHSMLAKDHFDLILNEPAGRIAASITQYSAKLIVQAWYNEKTDVNNTIDQILEVIHHPYFAKPDSVAQTLMRDEMRTWMHTLSGRARSAAVKALAKESVRRGLNKRAALENLKGLNNERDFGVRWAGGNDSYIKWENSEDGEGNDMGCCVT